MFDLRANSTHNRKNNVKINYQNWRAIVTYPEHENKSPDLLAKYDLKNNIKLIDEADIFDKQVKQFEKDQKWKNNNIKQNIAREKKTKAQLEEWLKNKQVATSYTVQENHIFFQKKFNGDKNQITNFYQNALAAILKTTGIEKQRVIFAIIHFDQSNPHLHFSISNLKTKKFETLNNKELLVVNGSDFNPVTQLKKIQNAQKKWLFQNRLTDEEHRIFKTREYQKLFKEKYAKELDFHIPVIKQINKMYENSLYKNKSDFISIDKVRGYGRNVSNEVLNTRAWKNLKNEIIFKFRKGVIYKNFNLAMKKAKREKASIEEKNVIKANLEADMAKLENKYQLILEHKAKSFNPNISEQIVINKRKYFLRKDVDLYTLLGKTGLSKKMNNIQKNRLYNELLYFCYQRNRTPQELAQEIFEGKYVPKRYENNLLENWQNRILMEEPFERDEQIKHDRESFPIVKKQICQNVNENADKISMFINASKAKNLISIEEEVKKSQSIGIDANFVKAAQVGEAIYRSKKIKRKFKNEIINSPKMKKLIKQKSSSFKFSNKNSLLEMIDIFEQAALEEQKQLAKIWKQVEWEKELQELER